MPSICPKNWLKAKQLWIYAILLMSVGPVGPGVGNIQLLNRALVVETCCEGINQILCQNCNCCQKRSENLNKHI